MIHKVSVEKTMYCTGVVEVETSTGDEALAKVENMINNGDAKMEEIEWSGPIDDPKPINTTGDVDL